ncbi:succinate dehydrogenase, hydrophobic membrane anchor protein [Starkeya sp. ORNL1]|uniref:succinate dehydrogenase, hydrophobic membrane anchor protein n=1 Tax=Starkeya sp. ORNL1 TaxID=2709380 RepID=UPI001463C132|nr:succinate dehydrogenase, hydrophobic membrane anchor protein [Starkeya sp. ORNL1]QJP16192.1 succinate dehydrogenase, hydrophobic membrane anchor protein [Starkeya sp. ORNL1]
MSGNSGSTMRTTRRRVAGLGSARSGTGHFWLQRLTALANVPLVLAFLFIVIYAAGGTREEVTAILGQPIVAIVVLLALLSIVVHMRIGMQVIIEDYVQGEGAKVLALMANTFFTIAVGCAAAFAILKISFGG